MNPSDLLGGQPIQEMAPSVRGIRKAPGAHSVVAARHARVECIFRNIDTQYPVNHCPILPPRVFSESSASNNLVRRIYAHARPKIPSNLNSGAWKTGPNLPHRLIGQRDERGSPFSSLLGTICLFAKQSATYKVQGTRVTSRPPHKAVRAAFLHKMWCTTFYALCGVGGYVAFSAKEGRPFRIVVFERHITW